MDRAGRHGGISMMPNAGVAGAQCFGTVLQTMVKRFFMAAALLVGAAVFVPHRLFAQDSDVIVGRVTGETGEALVNARVEAMSTETEITHSVLTDKNGRYTIVFPDGGGTYVLRVTYLGYADF